jgi:uncharacterized protein (DUF433 family)
MANWMVTDPNTANGEPVFSGTEITVAELLEQLATGQSIADIARTRGGKVSPIAIAEAVRLASRALVENAARYVPAAPQVSALPDTPKPVPPAPVSLAQSLAGQLTLSQTDKLTYAVGERIAFRMLLTNLTAAPVKYSFLGVKVVNLDTGTEAPFHTSWSGDDKAVPAHGTGPVPGGWEDSLQIDGKGRFRLTLSACLAAMDDGRKGVGWQTLTQGLDITVGELAAGPTDVTTAGGVTVYSSHGVVGNAFRVENTTVEAGAPVWFRFKVTNSSLVPVNYSILAARTEEGQAAQSWTNQKLNPGQVLEWRDHLKFSAPGVYHLYLGIGYDNKDDCVAMRAPWSRLSESVTVTVIP